MIFTAVAFSGMFQPLNPSQKPKIRTQGQTLTIQWLKETLTKIPTLLLLSHGYSSVQNFVFPMTVSPNSM